MKKFKWMILDNLPTIWVGLVFAFGMILAYSHAGGMLAYAGYILWSANEYSDIFIADSGFLMMLAGGTFIVAEALGIVEEIV